MLRMGEVEMEEMETWEARREERGEENEPFGAKFRNN
jgi:hypothetical protein